MNSLTAKPVQPYSDGRRRCETTASASPPKHRAVSSLKTLLRRD